MHVAAVIPTYDERDNLAGLLAALRALDASMQLVVVDDASPDGTADLADELASTLGPLHVIRRPGKLGLGSAYRAGFAWAMDHGADICVQMDADLSHDPGVVPALVTNVELGADLVIGSRYVPGGGTQNWPRRRLWLSRWGNRYAAGVLGLAVNDATSGFRAYSSAMLRRIDVAAVQTDGYGFQVEMTHRVVAAGGRIVEFPILFRERAAGDSKMSSSIIGEAATLVPRLWFADRHGRRERRRRFG